MVFLEALLRRQLALSLRVAAAVIVLLGCQPLLAWLWADYTRIQVLSIPLPWIVLAVGSYPVMIACGLYYVRHAEAIDHEFSELMES
jgi:fatty acid desaturase